MNTLKDVICELQSYRKVLEMPSLTDDCILDCSTRIFNTISMSERKTVQSGKNEPAIKSANSPMTEKQRQFLIKNKYNGNMDLTKAEAHVLIQEFINNKKGSDL